MLGPFFWFFGALSNEGRVLSVLLSFIGTAALSVDTTQIYVLWSALTGAFVASFCVRAAFHLRAVKLRVDAPRRIAVGESATFDLTLINSGRVAVHDVRLSGPFLPWDGRWQREAPPIASVLPGASRGSSAQVSFVARGEHQLDVFSAARLVPGGLALGPRIESEPVRFLVVPAVARVARLELPHVARGSAGGERHRISRGDSRELFGVRPYRAGDPVRDLHPKTWARRGSPHVREFRDSPAPRVGLCVDDDASVGSEEAFEAALSVAAGVALHLTTGGASLEGLVLGAARHDFPRASGRGLFELAHDRLALAERSGEAGRPCAFEVLAPWLARLSAVVVVSTAGEARLQQIAEQCARVSVPLRLVRVVLDRGVFGAKAVPEARSLEERVVTVSAVSSGRPLSL